MHQGNQLNKFLAAFRAQKVNKWCFLVDLRPKMRNFCPSSARHRHSVDCPALSVMLKNITLGGWYPGKDIATQTGWEIAHINGGWTNLYLLSCSGCNQSLRYFFMLSMPRTHDIHLCAHFWPAANEYGLLDVPDERKQYQGEVPLMDGICIFSEFGQPFLLFHLP